MIPVLHGVWASGGDLGAFEHIETQTVGAGGATSVTFSSILGTYKHLQIRGLVRTVTSGNVQNVMVEINSDTTGTNYWFHKLQGDGSTASSNNAELNVLANIVAPDNANIFGGFVSDFLDYASTSKNKTMRTLSGYDANGSGNITLNSTLWPYTNAITQIVLKSQLSTFAQYSTFSLYGVK